jgi:dUTP pyrophosphatase
MFRSGAVVADNVRPIEEEQVQPNGVDLTLAAVYEPREPGRISRHSKEVGERQEVEVEEIGEHVPDTYYLPRGGYVVAYEETVTIPDGHAGFVYPRSTLLRNACMLNTAVWDAGYEGRGEGFLQVFQDIQIERGARIGQLVLAEADHDDSYDGSYQGEGLDGDG